MQFTCNLYAAYYRRKFRSQTSDKMDRWNAEMGRVREEKRREEERKFQKKEDPGTRKGRKAAKHCVFQWFVAPEGRKVGSLKRRVQGQLARWEMKNCPPLWCEAHLPVKKLKAPHVRSTFRCCDVKKAHAVVARSTFSSQNVQKHSRFGQLLKVEMSKKCTPLWREAHFEVKMLKDVKTVHLVKSEQNVRVLLHFQERWQVWYIWRRSAKMHVLWQAQYKRHVHQSC